MFRKPLLSAPRRLKQTLVVCLDLTLLFVSSVIVMGLRLEDLSPVEAPEITMTVIGACIAIPVFASMGLYRAIYRYAGLQAVFALNKALVLYSLLYILTFTVIGIPNVPRSLGIAQPMLFAILVMSSRLFARYWLGGMDMSIGIGSSQIRSVLIYGAGSAGRQLASSIYQSKELTVVGYVDDDDRLHGQILNGIPIYGPQKLDKLVSDRSITEILLALPSVTRSRRNEILELLKPLPLKVLTLPGIMDLANGKVSVSDLKDLEIEDLLGRDQVAPNPLMLAKNITNKVVMVTGAGGSIGSELCRQIINAAPATLLLLELSEFALYQVEQELQNLLKAGPNQQVNLVPLLASVNNEQRMTQIYGAYKPHTIYHAAAYKHVPIVEHNPAEGVRNNVWGTLVAARQAAVHGVRDFVLISTDKAVRPTNIMGATKRIAEMGLQALAQQQSLGEFETNFSMVRFGNVLGSSGSVVPLFRKQIEQGGPITLTDERITRYFMTIPEAAQLVIQAGAMATGGDVFVLDMGESVRIMDLARRMIELSGLTVKNDQNPKGDIVIEVTGLRPGEKLYEELLIGDNPIPTQHPRIMKAHETFLPFPEFMEMLQQLEATLKQNDVPHMIQIIKRLVSGYQPEGEVVDWLYLRNKIVAQGGS